EISTPLVFIFCCVTLYLPSLPDYISQDLRFFCGVALRGGEKLCFGRSQVFLECATEFPALRPLASTRHVSPYFIRHAARAQMMKTSTGLSITNQTAAFVTAGPCVSKVICVLIFFFQ